MENNDVKFLVALVRYPKFGAKRVAKLRNFFSCFEEAFRASEKTLIQAGIEPKIASEFLIVRNGIDPDQELELMMSHEVHAIAFGEPEYPKLLADIYDPPAILFVRGNLPDQPYLSVVGSRQMTRYGEQAARDILEPVVQSGVCIVSGLALGVDACAHRLALEGGGTTIAILASGLDEEHLGPKQNLPLSREIVERGGALISEFPIGTESFRGNFPFRNRIISGISAGVLVVEAAEKSGSLITARSALEQSREVFAVPGPITSPVSTGPNNLIKMGAHPATEAADVMEVLGLEADQNPADIPEPEGELERAIFDVLSKEPAHVDQIIHTTSLDTATVTGQLTLMEMKGIIRHVGGMNYVRR